MRFHILTIFPDMFHGPTSQGIVGRGIDSGIISINLTDIRDFTNDKHRSVDDYPFGGSPGMLSAPVPQTSPPLRAVRTTSYGCWTRR